MKNWLMLTMISLTLWATSAHAVSVNDSVRLPNEILHAIDIGDDDPSTDSSGSSSRVGQSANDDFSMATLAGPLTQIIDSDRDTMFSRGSMLQVSVWVRGVISVFQHAPTTTIETRWPFMDKLGDLKLKVTLGQF